VVAFIVGQQKLKIAVPKGRLYDAVVSLLARAGITLSKNGRSYRPACNDPEIEVKIFKSQNIPKLVELGSQDIGFTGYDWVLEQKAEVKELLDLEYNSVRIVAAIPKTYSLDSLKKRRIVVGSEYEVITKKFLVENGYDAVLLKTYGATEVFVPEDADMIVDNTSTGRTLKENNLKIVDTLLESTTRLIANKNSLQDSWKKKKIEDILLLLRSVLEGEKRVFIEMNVSSDGLDELIPVLPCLKAPTVSPLYGDQGYAIKVVVKKDEVKYLIPLLKEKGATGILVMNLEKVIP